MAIDLNNYLNANRFTPNLAGGIQAHTGELNSGNAVWLDENDPNMYVDLDIWNNGQGDSYLTYTDPITQEIETIASEGNANKSSKELIVNGDFSDGLSSWEQSKRSILSIVDNKLNMTAGTSGYGGIGQQIAGYKTGSRYVININLISVSGVNPSSYIIVGVGPNATFPRDLTYNMNNIIGPHYVAYTSMSADQYLNISLGGTSSDYPTDNITIDNVSLKEVLPNSTKYRMQKSFSNAFSTDVEVTQADRELIKARPEIVAILWFTGEQNGLSFTKDNIKNYYLANEGAVGGPLVYDVSSMDGGFYFKSTSTSQTYTFRSPIGTSLTLNGSVYDGNDNTNVVINTSDTDLGFIESVPGCITYFLAGNNGLSGAIPDLYANTLLTRFYCYVNNLTGNIPDLSTNISLAEFHCSNNRITGSIPDLSTNIVLSFFNCANNQLTGNIPSLIANIKLRDFHCSSNQLTGNIPDLSTNTLLNYFTCYNNRITGFNGGTIKVISLFDAHNNLLTIAAVDAILQGLVDGDTVNATIRLEGGNGIPTNTSAIDTLRANGCTVTVEGGY